MIDIDRIYFLGLLISCAWWTGTSGTLTSSNSSWPTALMVYQSGLGGESSAYIARLEECSLLVLGRTDSRSDTSDRQAGHGILDQVRAARPEEGGGLGVGPGVVARVVDAADSRGRSSVSVCLGLRNRWRVWVGVGAKTYPAMVEGVRFQEQNLGGYTLRERGGLGLCDGILKGRLIIRCSSLRPKYGVT